MSPDSTSPPVADVLSTVLSLLDRAELACRRRGGAADSPLDDGAVWYLDSAQVWFAGQALCDAGAEIRDHARHSVQPLVDAVPTAAGADEDPVVLLEAAWELLETVPPDRADPALSEVGLWTRDALATVRARYA